MIEVFSLSPQGAFLLWLSIRERKVEPGLYMSRLDSFHRNADGSLTITFLIQKSDPLK